jgi:hypothetical protein
MPSANDCHLSGVDVLRRSAMLAPSVVMVVMAALCLPVVGSGTALGSDTRAASGASRTANEIPVDAVAGAQDVAWLSCPSAGDCGAGGAYVSGAGQYQAYVVSERNGHLGKAIEVPGTAALNTGRSAADNVGSCPSAGNCGTGGVYTVGTSSGPMQAFVVSERSGRWARAIEVPGTAALNVGGSASVDAISCPSAGNCVAGGSYADGAGHTQVFVVSERNGWWGKAIEVPGTAALNVGGSASVDAISCPSAGNCGAGGVYTDGHFNGQVFVVSERNGHWSKATIVPGPAGLSFGGPADVVALSCPSAGNCLAGMSYSTLVGPSQAYVARERNGRWAKAIVLPGTRSLNTGGYAAVSSVSCSSAVNCGAAGDYTGRARNLEPFVASERNGRWAKAIEVPGAAALNVSGYGHADVIACPSAGNCGAGGTYAGRAASAQVFVVTERNGRWGKAIEVPGTAALNAGGDADVSSMSCPSAGNCVAGGFYTDIDGALRAFMINERNGRWAKAITVPAPA